MRKIMMREMKRMKREMRMMIRVLAPSLKPFCCIEDSSVQLRGGVVFMVSLGSSIDFLSVFFFTFVI